MKCFNHPEIDAVGTCIKCGKALCNDCRDKTIPVVMCMPCAYSKNETTIPKPEPIKKEVEPTITAVSKKSFPLWGILLIILAIMGVIGGLISGISDNKATTEKLPGSLNIDCSLQVDRLDAINELIDDGYFQKIDRVGEYARVWITPLFYLLDYDKKQGIISIVAAYYWCEDQSKTTIFLYDNKTGKNVGHFSEYGFELK